MTEQTDKTEQEEKRKAWEARTRAKLDELNAQIEHLKADSLEASEDIRAKNREWMEQLREGGDRLRDQLESVRKNGESSWKQVRDGTEAIWNDLSSALGGARDALESRKRDRS